MWCAARATWCSRCAPDDTVEHLLAVLEEHRIGALVVSDGRRDRVGHRQRARRRLAARIATGPAS